MTATDGMIPEGTTADRREGAPDPPGTLPRARTTASPPNGPGLPIRVLLVDDEDDFVVTRDTIAVAERVALRDELRPLPILVVATGAVRKEAEASRRTGAAAYLTHPTEPGELIEAMAAVVGRPEGDPDTEDGRIRSDGKDFGPARPRREETHRSSGSPVRPWRETESAASGPAWTNT